MSETAILAALSRLESGQGRIEVRLDKLEAGQTKLESRMSAVESSQTSLRVDIMDRMDRLENALTGIRDDVVVNIGAADYIRTMHGNTREEVRLIGDHVARLFMQIKGIQARLRDISGEP